MSINRFELRHFYLGFDDKIRRGKGKKHVTTEYGLSLNLHKRRTASKMSRQMPFQDMREEHAW